jgi:hypothetical protein
MLVRVRPRTNTDRGWWVVPALFPPPPATFSQIYIAEVYPPVQTGTELLLSWRSTAPAGLWYQIYGEEQLVWFGTSTRAAIPLPLDMTRIDIGTVSSANRAVSFAGSLPAYPSRRVNLSWIGGTYEGADLVGFHVYGEQIPGAGIDYVDPLASVQAYTAGIITDGFGYGGFGSGGFGAGSASYSWTSDPKSPGAWNWAVRPFDTAGNEGTAGVVEVIVAVPPNPPGPFAADRTRLHYTYAQPTKKITLNWNPSPV